MLIKLDLELFALVHIKMYLLLLEIILLILLNLLLFLVLLLFFLIFLIIFGFQLYMEYISHKILQL